MASVGSGADDLRAIGRALKAQSGTELKKEMLRGIRTGVKPTIAKIKASTGDYLPNSGGLADRVAKSSIGTRTRLTGANAGISIKGTGKQGSRGLAAMNDGTVRHPVFGRRRAWVSQSINPGFFSEPIEGDVPAIRSTIQRVMDDVANKIVRAV